VKLMDALAEVGQSDLDELDKEIEAIQNRLDQLKEVRKIIQIKLGLRNPVGANFRGGRKSRDAVSPSVEKSGSSESPQLSSQMTVTEQYRSDARKFIMANGPQQSGAIARACGIPSGSITAVLKHKSFKQCQHGWELSGLSQ